MVAGERFGVGRVFFLRREILQCLMEWSNSDGNSAHSGVRDSARVVFCAGERGGSSAYPGGWDRRREVRKMWREHVGQRGKERRHEDGRRDKK